MAFSCARRFEDRGSIRRGSGFRLDILHIIDSRYK